MDPISERLNKWRRIRQTNFEFQKSMNELAKTLQSLHMSWNPTEESLDELEERLKKRKRQTTFMMYMWSVLLVVWTASIIYQLVT